MLVDVHGTQIGIEEQTLRLQIHRRLATSLVAERPFRIDETPEGGTCNSKRKKEKRRDVSEVKLISDK